MTYSWRQHPIKQQLYGHLPPIMKTIPLRRTRHAGHSWRSWEELISDVLLWTSSQGRAKAGRPAWTHIQQFCEETECSPGDQPETMTDKEGWQEKVRDIRADGTTRWWWFSWKPALYSFCNENNDLPRNPKRARTCFVCEARKYSWGWGRDLFNVETLSCKFWSVWKEIKTAASSEKKLTIGLILFLPSGGRAAFLSPLSPMYGTRPSV